MGFLQIQIWELFFLILSFFKEKIVSFLNLAWKKSYINRGPQLVHVWTRYRFIHKGIYVSSSLLFLRLGLLDEEECVNADCATNPQTCPMDGYARTWLYRSWNTSCRPLEADFKTTFTYPWNYTGNWHWGSYITLRCLPGYQLPENYDHTKYTVKILFNSESNFFELVVLFLLLNLKVFDSIGAIFGTFLPRLLHLPHFIFKNNCFLRFLCFKLWNELERKCLLKPNLDLSNMTFYF